MKRLLSICFLSMLLALAGFTANAQCCFWLENLQPDTVQDVSNLGLPSGSTAALLPGHGNPLVLSNNLSRVDNLSAPSVTTVNGQQVYVHPRTDWYQVHVSNCDPNTKVSLEWKLYRNGVLIPDATLSDYADIYIFTRFSENANTSNVNSTCGYAGWFGGLINGPSTCQFIQNNCVGGYPGSAKVDGLTPYTANGYTAQGFVNVANAYHLDYLYLGFLQSTETRFAINWKQVGNYALVVGLRERTNGTDFSIWQNDNQNAFIGGHSSCCGALLATDSLTYPIFTSSQYAMCDGDSYIYGQPQADYTVQGQYNVLFGNYVCDHWEFDHLDVLSLYTRINPAIVAHDLTVCKNEVVTNDQFAALVTPVDLDAPGYLEHKIYWRAGTSGTWSEEIPAHPTNTPGSYIFQVYQSNHYDAVTGQDFWCDGPVATIVFDVLDVLRPELYNTNRVYEFCTNELPTDLVLKAKLNDANDCADNIHWFNGYEVTDAPVFTGALDNGISTFTLSLPAVANEDDVLHYTAFSYDESTQTYSTTGVGVTIYIWSMPELSLNSQNDSIVVCPHASRTLNSAVSCGNLNNNVLDWTYVWTKNGQPLSFNTRNINIEAPGCDQKDVYTVTATAKYHNCETSITRRITIEGYDHSPLTISWRNSNTATATLYGCDTLTLYNGSVWDTPYTIRDASPSGFDNSVIRINEDNCSNAQQVVYTVDVNTTVPHCSTVVTRSYKIVDECGNESNTINQVVTILNNAIPTIDGEVVEVAPVRPLNNDCKVNLPERDVLLAAFHANFTMITGCDAPVADEDIEFYLGNTDVLAAGYLDVFADVNMVNVYAQVKDACGNVSAKMPVFIVYKPAEIDITHGAISSLHNELCNYERSQVSFDTLMILNGFTPFTFAWSQTPVDVCNIIPSANGISAEVWPVNDGPINTIAQFIMTIVDKYGCVATDTSNAIRWFGRPTFDIVERSVNDDYPHAEPVVVCPSFGHYLLNVDNALSNLPYPEYSQELAYRWNGEAIDHTSHDRYNFIAVNENNCDRLYTDTAFVTNAKGCTSFHVYYVQAEDTQAPVVTLDMVTDTLPLGLNCKIVIPDYTVLFNNSNVSDDCWNMDSIKVTQDIAAGTSVGVDTDVTITIAPKCGPSTIHVIRACFPANQLSTEILASVDNSCFPYTTVFTATTENATAPVEFFWDGAAASANSLTFTTESETENLTHTVLAVDANGCEAIDSYTLTVHHKPVAGDVTITTTPNQYCDDVNFNGTYTIVANHSDIDGVREVGTTEWHTLPYTATVAHGTYAFDLHTIYDCVSTNVVNTIVDRDTTDANLVPVLSIITDNANCTAPWSGTIRVNNPIEGYAYHVSAGAENSGNETFVWDPSIYHSSVNVDFNYLYQDDYTVSVVSTFNCHASAVITVEDHRVIPSIPTMTLTANTSCVNPNGTIILHNTNAAWVYEINGISAYGSGSDLVMGTNFLAGSYTLTISNMGTRCVNSEVVVVPDESNAPIIPEITINNNTFCVGANGSIVLASVVPGIQYTLAPVADPTDVTTLATGTNRFDGLAEGEYILTLLDPISGCSGSNRVVVGNTIPTFNWTITSTADKDCSELGTGVATIKPNAVNNIATFTAVDQLGVEYPLNALNAGTYTVTAIVTETGCAYTKSLEVSSSYTYPNIVANTTANYNCDPVKNGTIVFTDGNASGNYSSVSFFVDGVSETSPVTGLNSGDYTITAVSNYNCEASPVTVTVVDSAFVVRNFTVTPNSICNATLSKPGNGKIRVDYPQSEMCDYIFTDLTPTHAYDVNHFEPIDYTKHTLEEGWYKVDILDNRTGCSSTDTVYVPFQPVPVNVDDIIATPDYICTTGVGNGTITINATSESAAAVLEYSMDGTNYQSNNVFTNLDAGSYNLFFVRNLTTNCVYEVPLRSDVIIEQGEYEINVSFDNVPNTACDASMYNGEVHVVATYVDPTLGTGDFTYTISGGSFTGLNGGNYVVTVLDNNTGCEYVYNTKVEDDAAYTPQIVVDAFNYNQNPEQYHYCFGQTDGYLVATATSSLEGDNDFTYQWSSSCNHINPDGAWTDIYAEQSFCCTYTVVVTSNLTGCSNTKNVQICIDTLPVVHFYMTDKNGIVTPTSTTPNVRYENCENNAFTLCVVDPGFQTINWTNAYTGTTPCVNVPAFGLNVGDVSFCVKVVDFNGCATGPVAANVKTLPIFHGAETINACNVYNFIGNRVPDQTFVYSEDLENQYVVVDTLNAVNGCDSIVTYTINISTDPTLIVDIATELTQSYCSGSKIITTGLGYTASHAVASGWRLINGDQTPSLTTVSSAGVEFDPTAPLTYDMNGKKVYAYALNGCDVLMSEAYLLNVTDIPMLDNDDKSLQPATICLGASAPYDASSIESINWNGSIGTAVVEYTRDGETWNTLSDVVYPALEDNFQIRISATNDCGNVILDGPVTITVNDVVTFQHVSGALVQTICLDNEIEPIQFNVSATDVVVTGLPDGVTYNDETHIVSGIPTTVGVYNFTLVASNDNDCGDITYRGSIQVDAHVVLDVTNNTQEICLGDSIVDVVITSENATLTLTPAIVNGLTLNDTLIVGSPMDAGDYSITIDAVSNNVCPSKSATVNIVVNDTVKLSVENTEQIFCLGESIDDIIIVAENAVLSVTGLPETLTLNEGVISGTPIVADTINYTITANSEFGCSAKSASGVIIVNDTVKLTVADPSSLTQTVCKNTAIQDIIFNVENATLELVGTVPAGIVLENNVVKGIPTSMDLVGSTFNVVANSNATPSCGSKSYSVTITVNDAPAITGTISNLEVCVGDVFAMPAEPAFDNNGLATTTSWMFNGEEFDWTAPSTLDMNGKNYSFEVSNACGSDVVEAMFVVNDLPVPVILSDTVICEDGVATISTTTGFASYQWFMDGVAIFGATNATYNYAATGADIVKFTVEVVDANGCISVENINGTVDARYFSTPGVVTVVSDSRPGFVFTKDGVETHTISANTADPSTTYNWMVVNDCAYEGDLVFVNFDIFFNDHLIDNDSIGLYIDRQTVSGTSGPSTQYYVTKDYIEWNTVSGTPQNETCYYNYAQSTNTVGSTNQYLYSNHYPVGRFAGSGDQFDDLYLHFLTNRPVVKTINQFRRAGTYKIEYRLIATSNSNPFGHLYQGNLPIGGHNAIVATAVLDTLAFDVITINVTGEDAVDNAPAMSPMTPMTEVTAAPSMEVYPNPAQNSDQVKARINGINGKTMISIVNLAGKVLSLETIDIISESYLYTTEISNLAPGVYFIYVQGENGTISKKLVITK